MVIADSVEIIDVTLHLMKASESKFFHILEILEIQSFKIISLIKLIVDGGSVKIIDATFDDYFAPISNQKFLI